MWNPLSFFLDQGSSFLSVEPVFNEGSRIEAKAMDIQQICEAVQFTRWKNQTRELGVYTAIQAEGTIRPGYALGIPFSRGYWRHIFYGRKDNASACIIKVLPGKC